MRYVAFVSGVAAPTGESVYIAHQHKWEHFVSGAFANVGSQDVVANINHTGGVLASTKNGTLELRETERGLEYCINIENTEAGRQLLEAFERKAVRGVSVGFHPWMTERRGNAVVTTETVVFEVSFCIGGAPVYGDKTSATLRWVEL